MTRVFRPSQKIVNTTPTLQFSEPKAATQVGSYADTGFTPLRRVPLVNWPRHRFLKAEVERLGGKI
jgi:hypothetical protein